MPFFSAYGLVFDSELLLPEFASIPETDHCDVKIRLGVVPERLNAPLDSGALYQIGKDDLRYEIPGIARYYVSGGNEILIDPAPDRDEDTVRAFLLTAPLSALLHQRRMMPLRASAIDTPRGAVLFMGYSSIGKSTLAAAFVRKGYRLISDNMTTLELGTDGRICAQPAYPTMKLWELSTWKFGIDVEPLRQVRPGWHCYLWNVGDQFQPQPQPIASIIVLTLGRLKNRERLEVIQPMERTVLLSHNLYNDRFAVRMGIIGAYWSRLTAASRIDTQHMQIDPDIDALDGTVAELESRWI